MRVEAIRVEGVDSEGVDSEGVDGCATTARPIVSQLITTFNAAATPIINPVLVRG